ncbi:MAG: hypothetical protein RLZZ546_1320 [Bacteroidota bacterium]|jgi:hypothetical protein
MALAHFTNVTPTATNLYEPLYGNLFEITFQFPSILGFKNNQTEMNMMMLNARNIKLELTKNLKVEKQFFKYSGRQFLNVNKENSIIEDLDINFNVNVDDKFSMTTWNLLKKWYDLAWNSQTGELHYKREMVGEIIVHVHDRQGIVIRRVEFKNVQLYGVKEQEFNWDEESILDTNAKFIADYWTDVYFDIK